MMVLTQIRQMFHFMHQQDLIAANDLTLKMMTDPDKEFRSNDLAIELEATNEDLTLVTASVLAQLLEQHNAYGALEIIRKRNDK